MLALVTGATGLIGSHLVEALEKRGDRVRVLVRRTSDLSEIAHTRAQKFYGDVTDPASLAPAVAGVDVVFHTAARMNDWGPWPWFLEQNVIGTGNLADASLAAGVSRFVHVSSTGVTGLHALRGADETFPYAPEGHYEESKVQSEQLVLRYHRERRLPAVIVRPCWTLGPRARRHIPLMVEYLSKRKLMYLGSGSNLISVVDPRDVAQGLILAATEPRAAGQIYHLTNGSHTDTQAECYRLVCEFLGVKPPRMSVPFPIALALGWIAEKWALWRDWDDAPMLTPVRVKFLALDRHLLCEKAKRELGYRPRYTLRESLRDAVAWNTKRLSREAYGYALAAAPQA
jgi:2-alkyl-3-oxoalkanoate reductase